MDIIGNMGVDGLRTAIWIVAIMAAVIVAGLQIWLPVMDNWQTSWRHRTLVVLRGLLAGVVAYAVANVAVVFYILAHATDPRWSVGKDAHIDAPKLSAGIPLFDGIVNALNGFGTTVENGVNDALAIKNAVLVSGEFMLTALWSLVPLAIVAVLTLGMSRYVEWWRARRVDDLVVRNAQLEADVAEMRKHMNLPVHAPKKPN